MPVREIRRAVKLSPLVEREREREGERERERKSF